MERFSLNSTLWEKGVPRNNARLLFIGHDPWVRHSRSTVTVSRQCAAGG